MKITPLDIQQQQFKGKMLGGLDPEDVDSFLQAVAHEMEELVRENNNLKEQLSRQNRNLDELTSKEKDLRETMLAAQRITEDMKTNAQKEADLLVSEARIEARKLVDDAERQVAELQVKANDVRRGKLQFETELKALLDSYKRLLETGKNEQL